MMVVVERAQALMHADLESESLRDPLNGQVAKLQNLILFHHNYEFFLTTNLTNLTNGYLAQQFV